MVAQSEMYGLRYVSGWHTEYRCVGCKTTVSHHTKMYSHGRCPSCGYKSENTCAIMETKEIPYRLVSNAKWWQFWIKPIREYPDGV